MTDPIATVGAGIRAARLPESDPEFWRTMKLRKAANHVALYMALQVASRHAELTDGQRAAALAALAEYQAIHEALRTYVRPARSASSLDAAAFELGGHV